MYHLKYFIPLVIEASKRGIKSTFYNFHVDSEYQKVIVDDKNNPSYNSHPYRHYDHIRELGDKFGFEFKVVKSGFNMEGITFLGEKRGLNHIENNDKTYKVVLTVLLDFTPEWYDGYIGKVDKVIFASKFLAERYGKINNKNLYLGSPKYDVEIDKNKVKDKYNITTDKNALIIFPETHDLAAIKFANYYDYLRRMGYFVIVKGRDGWKPPQNLMGDKYIGWETWYPHPTMELLKISDVVVNFDSGTSKECVMLNVPFINFRILKAFVPFDFLQNYDYCKNLNLNVDFNEFSNSVGYLVDSDLSEEFKRARDNHLFEAGQSASRIMEAMEKI